MKIVTGIDIFLKNCNTKNLALKTINTYRERLIPFYVCCYNDGITELESITREYTESYISDLLKRYSPATVRGKFIAVKVFFNFLVAHEYIINNPVKSLKLPKIPKVYIGAFTRDEVRDILNVFDKGSFLGYRNYVIMLTLFSTGLRKSELIALSIEDIQTDISCIKVYGKGSKERFVPIGDTLQKVLARYLKRRNEYINAKGYNNTYAVFISRIGKPLKPSGLNAIFQGLKKNKAKWSTKVSAHTWRHTFAKMFLLNGGDIFTLQKILGHEDISTTRLYLDLNTQELQVQNNKYNPLENTRWKYY